MRLRHGGERERAMPVATMRFMEHGFTRLLWRPRPIALPLRLIGAPTDRHGEKPRSRKIDDPSSPRAIAHQMRLPNQPNCICRTAKRAGGAARLFAILRWAWSMGSRFLVSDSWLDGCSCANASRSTVEATISGATALASMFAICAGGTRLVS